MKFGSHNKSNIKLCDSSVKTKTCFQFPKRKIHHIRDWFSKKTAAAMICLIVSSLECCPLSNKFRRISAIILRLIWVRVKADAPAMMLSGAKSNETREWDSLRSLTLSESPIRVKLEVKTVFKSSLSQSLHYDTLKRNQGFLPSQDQSFC